MHRLLRQQLPAANPSFSVVEPALHWLEMKSSLQLLACSGSPSLPPSLQLHPLPPVPFHLPPCLFSPPPLKYRFRQLHNLLTSHNLFESLRAYFLTFGLPSQIFGSVLLSFFSLLSRYFPRMPYLQSLQRENYSYGLSSKELGQK